MNNETPPAAGERRALVGLTAQYRVAARIIYDALLQDQLEWVRFVDLEAGRVDDLQIAGPGTLHAYQIKWSDFPATWTFRELTYSSDGPCLIKQLADGWKLLRGKYPELTVYVHLLTDNQPSPSTAQTIPLSDPPPQNPHLGGFHRDAWPELQSGRSVPRGWQPAVEALRTASELEASEFYDFCQHCHFDFGFQLEESLSPGLLDERRSCDIRDLSESLKSAAATLPPPVHFDRAQLLVHQRWTHRFQPRFRHELPVDLLTYQPIEPTVARIEECLQLHTSGYLALVGPPGSGKSTTLQRTLRYRPGFRLIRYYCFIRDDPVLGRGESTLFLNELVLQLRREGIGQSLPSIPNDRGELVATLQVQLQELGARWQECGERTVIMIDGLDHIERELQPERSLLSDLPLPAQLQEGVVIVLGTQTLELQNLPPRIRQQASRRDRLIRIDRLSRDATRRILEASQLQVDLAEPEQDEVYRLSDGHPLALSYLIQRLRSLNTNSEVRRVLGDATAYSGDIEDDYRLYWRLLSQDDQARELLGLLSRLRIPIPYQTVVPQDEQPILRRLLGRGRQFFSIDGSGRCTFFHNSFRQFVLLETMRDVHGELDTERNKILHRSAAAWAAEAQPTSAFHWEQLFHLWKACDYQAVLRLASQEWFRKQFMAFRPSRAIVDDISLLLRAAKEARDGIAVARALLVEHELGNRAWVLEQVDLPSILLELRGAESASTYCLEGKQLVISRKEAIKSVDKIVSHGYKHLAAPVFDAAEPLALLNGTSALSEHWGDDHELLVSWAVVARSFRPLRTILETLTQVRIEEPRRSGAKDLETIKDELIEHILLSLARTLAENCEEELLDELLCLISERPESQSILNLVHILWCSYQPASDRAREYLAVLSQGRDWSESAFDDRLQFAEAAWAVSRDSDQVESLIAGEQQPALVERHPGLSSRRGLHKYSTRIRLNRLLAATKNSLSPELAVPSTEEADSRAIAFERSLVRLANVRGSGERGDLAEPTNVLLELMPALLLYDRRDRQSEYREVPSWNTESLAQDYFDYVVRAASSHGPRVLLLLAEEFEKLWQRPESCWPVSLQREIATSLERAGLPKEWLADQLDRLEARLDIDFEIEERIEELSAQCLAWIRAGQHDRADSLLNQMLQTSFGVYYRKDTQFLSLVAWLGKATDVGADNLSESFRQFANAASTIGRNNRGEKSAQALTSLLDAAARLEPSYSLVLRRWLMETSALRFVDGVAGILFGAVSTENPPIQFAFVIFRRLVIPFASQIPEKLCERLARIAVEVLKREEAEKELLKTGLVIDTKAFPSAREELYRAMRTGVMHADFDLPWLRERLHGTRQTRPLFKNEHLRLSDGTELTFSEVEARVSSIGDLRAIVDEIAPEHSSFDWHRILQPLILSCGHDELASIEDIVVGPLNSHRCRVLLAERYLELGDLRGSERIALQFLEDSSESGWTRWWDGGSRLDAYRLLYAADPRKYGPEAFEAFVNDYLSAARHTSWLVKQLDEMIPVPLGELDEVALWSEVAEHARQLCEFALGEGSAPGIPDESVGPSNMLARLLFEAIETPVFELRDEAFRAAIEVAASRNHDTELTDQIQQSLNGVGPLAAAGLALLECLSKVRPDFIAPFESFILELARSGDYSVRRTAARILIARGVQVPKPPPVPLPPSYRFDLPPLREFDAPGPLTVLPSSASTPDTRDPVELTRVIREPLEFLARRSGVPLQNLVHRAAYVMSRTSPQTDWDRAAEERLQAWCRALDLQTPFLRPRASIAFRALAHLIAELVDSGKLNESADGYFLDSYSQVLDLPIAFLEAVRRPGWIESPFPDSDWHRYAGEWKKSATESLGRLRARLPDGSVVLGESTVFQRLEWSLPVEYRYSVVCHPDWIPSEPPTADAFFPTTNHWRASAYPHLRGLDHLVALVLQGLPRQANFGRQEWLAFNPIVAEFLGWRVDPERPFGWVDSVDESQVYSICWQDGPQGRHPPSRDVCSSGWLVVASKCAAETLRSQLLHLHCVRGVRRVVTGNSASETGDSHVVRRDADWDLGGSDSGNND